MTKTDSVYDLIVIGTGVAASTVAWECHSAGWKIAVIDSRPFGGTCALRGCEPKEGVGRCS
jgi:glutathione reductase (NADPH)